MIEFIEVKVKGTAFMQVPVSQELLPALAEVCSYYGISRNVALASAAHLFVKVAQKGGVGGRGIELYLQKAEAALRTEALTAAIEIASELETHPDTEEQMAKLERLCLDWGFVLQDIIERGKIAVAAAERLRSMSLEGKDEKALFLAGLLMPVGTRVPYTVIEQKWKEAGYPRSMLNRVKRVVGAESERMAEGWSWYLK